MKLLNFLLKPFFNLYKWLMRKQAQSILRPQINEMFMDEAQRELFLSKMRKQAKINKYGKYSAKYKPTPSINQKGN